MRAFAVILVGMTAMASHASAGNMSSEAQSIEALTHAKVQIWRKLYRENDVEGLDAFLADDFVIVGSNGSEQTKTDILTDLRDNPWVMPADFLYTVTNVILLTPDSAIVYGHGDSTRTLSDGQACHHNYTSSNTFRFEDGQWRPVSSHVSDSSCEPL